jgi:hypothetical protein
VLGELPPAVVLLAAWLVLFVYAYPGQMTQDSFDQLAEARAGVYTDSHPPITSLVWKLVEYVIAGAFGMLIVQSLAFLLGLYALFRHYLTARRAAWVAALIFLFPPVFVLFGVIWKDCLMAGFLVLGAAGLVAASLRLRLLGLAALVLATGFRYNAAAATLPLIVLIFEWRPGLRWWKRAAIGLVAWLAVTGAAFGINRALTDRPMHFWYASTAIYDIVGTIAKTDATLGDAELDATLAGTGLLYHDHLQQRARVAFNPRNFLPILTSPEHRMWDLPAYGGVDVPPETRAAIARAWSAIVTNHVGAYLSYRLAVMSEVLSLRRFKPIGVVTPRLFALLTFAYAQNIPVRFSPTQRGLTEALRGVWRVVPIFLPWSYAVLAIAVGIAAIRRRSMAALALCGSGLAMEASLFVLVGTPDYRYSHWLVVAACTALVIVLAQRARSSSPNPNRLPIT